MERKQFKNQNGITLIALLVTIIVLIILAGIAISMTIGDNGIFAKAKEAKRLQITAEAKEKIGTEILAAQVEAIGRNEELEQAQVEDIISKYGTLQDDKDTIILKDNGYEISLLDIYQGTTTSSGSYTENKAKIELLEGQVKRLQEQIDSMSQTGDEKDKKIAELNEKVTTIENEKNELQNKANELVALKENLGKVTATENQILKSYTAYKDGKLITGTMVNYAGKTVTAKTAKQNGDNAEITIPSAGYYGVDSKISVPISEINSNSASNMNILNYVPTNVKYYNSSSYGTAKSEAIGLSSSNLVSNQSTYSDYADITLPKNWKIKEGDTLMVYGQYGASGGQGYRLGFVDIDGTYHELYGDFTNGGLTNSYKQFISLESYKGINISKIRITIFPINASVWVKLTQLRLCSQFQ